MTDEELREKIAKLADLLNVVGGNREKQKAQAVEIADMVIALYKEAGYRKVRRGIPPVLSDEEIGDLIDLDTEVEYSQTGGGSVYTFDVRPLLQKQIDADARYFLGETEPKKKGDYRKTRGCAPVPPGSLSPEDAIRKGRGE